MTSQDRLAELTVEIVSAFVGNNSIPPSELPRLIVGVYGALAGAASPSATSEPQVPSVAVRKSVTPDYIICLEDGAKLKMLKRHLRTRFDMTPEEYRRKWHLPADYPMTAPSYSKARSELAREIGLGQKSSGRRKQLAAAASATAPKTASAGGRRRARKTKAAKVLTA
jgi:predicted transcriptional regulator